MRSEKIYLGIDGGGTRCRARIASQNGQVLGESVSGGANTRLGIDHVFSEITNAAKLALKAANLPTSTLSHLHAGLGLAGLPLERERRRAESHRHPFASVCYATDAHIACLGAHNGNDGGVLIVGTGVCGTAIVNQKCTSVAGWGFEISDIGGGARIGRRAIEASLLAHEGLVQSSELTKEVMSYFNNSPEEVVIFAEKALPADYGKFCPMVFSADEMGDKVAREIIQVAVSINSNMLLKLHEFGAPRLSIMGGLATLMSERMSPTIKALLSPPAHDALQGAIFMAMQHQERSYDAGK